MVYKKYFVKELKLKTSTKTKTYCFPNHPRLNMTQRKFYFYIPAFWEILFIQPNVYNFVESTDARRQPYLFLYSTQYFFKLILPKYFLLLYFCKYSRVVTFFVRTTLNSGFPLYLWMASTTLYSFSKPLFLRIKFKGKGYYIFKTLRNTIAPQFGYAHRIYIYALFLSVKFLRKTSILIFGLQWLDLLSVGLKLYAKRPVNIFTTRGVRFSRQIIYKKKGKVSTYR